MLPLAEFIMRGRGQALAFVLIALVTSPILWPNSILAAAAISLVWLRIGIKEGSLLWLWSLLPAGALAYYLHSEHALLLVCSISLASWVLKATYSWRYTLMSLTLCGIASAFALETFATESLSMHIDIINKLRTQMTQSMSAEQLAASPWSTLQIDQTLIAGFYATTLIISSFVSLALGRSWQAKLYNPGGFQQEFHQLRLGRLEIITGVLLAALIMQLGEQYLTWVWIAVFPLVISGIALCHALAKKRNIATHWYVIFYFVLLSSAPFMALLIVLAIVDSLVDIRGKVAETDNRLDS